MGVFEKQRVAGVILYRDKKVLLQHRDDKPEIRYPGYWAIFGGHIETGEEPEPAAIREIQEELGLTLEGPLHPAWEGEDEVRHRWFYAAALEVPLESLTLMEGQGMALLSDEDLDRYPVVPLHRRILREFFASRGDSES